MAIFTITRRDLSEHIVTVDDDDLPRVLDAASWYVGAGGRYVLGYIRGSGAGAADQYLHRFVLGYGPGDPEHVDHRDGNGLDCRRSNLRVTNMAGNLANQPVRSTRAASGYRGVHRHPDGWVAAQTVNRRARHIGLYRTPDEAAAAIARFREEQGLPAWR